MIENDITVEGLRFRSCSTAFMLQQGTHIITSTRFEDNTEPIIIKSQSRTTITNTSFSHSTSRAMTLESGSSTSIISSLFHNNSWGGINFGTAIYVDQGAELQTSDCNFRFHQSGSTLYLSANSQVFLNHSQFIQNNQAVVVHQNAILEGTSCTFYGHTNTAILVSILGSASFNNCTFSFNSGWNGGAISAQSDVTLIASLLHYNYASNSGGAIYIDIGELHLEDTRVTINNSPYGGGMMITGTSSCILHFYCFDY